MEVIGILNLNKSPPPAPWRKEQKYHEICNIQSKFQNASEVESDVLWRMKESFEASFIKLGILERAMNPLGWFCRVLGVSVLLCVAPNSHPRVCFV